MSHVIIECGSAARGDTNRNSDLDLVCIWSGKPPNYLTVGEKHEDIMFYSVETIKRMREKGSLFLTHLDVDSIYIEGDKDLLKLFKGYRPPKRLLEKLFQDTRNFILEIKWHPHDLLGLLWLCDVLYVSLRNCIYCKNAFSDRYVFGYTDALKELGLSSSETSIMLDLREGKYIYRRGSFEEINFNIRNIEYTCETILNCPVSFVVGGTTDWSRNWRMDYWDERLIERAILNKEHNDDEFLKKIRRHNYNKFSLRSDMKRIVEMHISTTLAVEFE